MKVKYLAAVKPNGGEVVVSVVSLIIDICNNSQAGLKDKKAKLIRMNQMPPLCQCDPYCEYFFTLIWDNSQISNNDQLGSAASKIQTKKIGYCLNSNTTTVYVD